MRTTTTTILAALLFLCTIPPASAAAQEPGLAEHRGFWIGFGLGGGTNLSDWADGGRGGVGAYLRLGGTISRQLVLGGEIIGWGRDREGTTFSETGLTAVAQFYPARTGIFVKAGAGFAGWATSTSSGSTTTTTTAGGFAGTLGVGYDLRIGSSLFLTPNVDFLFHSLESDNTAFADLSSGKVLLFTLGLTWY